MPKILLEKEINLKKVLDFAAERHKGQKRDNGDEYIVHPIRVTKIVDKFKGRFSDNRMILLAASLLHDTLEDTYTSYRELKENFGEEVASTVLELTTAKTRAKMIGKGIYLAEKMRYMTSYALTIKLADRLDNVCDLKSSSKEKRDRIVKDTSFILNYLEKYREFTRPQREIINEIKKQLEILKSDNA